MPILFSLPPLLAQTLGGSPRAFLKQLQEVTLSHSEALHRLEEQEKSHRALIHKSNSLTTLLRQDRERFVQQTQHM